MIEKRSPGREALQVRCLDRVLIVKQGRPIVHIIDRDEQNVGLFLCNRTNRCQEQVNETTECSFDGVRFHIR